MQNVSDAVTNPLIKLLSPSLPVLIFSHAPNRSNLLSRSIASPITAPIVSDAIIIIAPINSIDPSALSLNIFVSVLPIPMKITAVAHAICNVC